MYWEMSAETWSEDAKLYQPFALEQSLLHENASCLAVIAFLKICGLPHKVVECANAEFMATNGRLSRLPLLSVGKMSMSEFEPIARYATAAVQQQTISPTENDNGNNSNDNDKEDDDHNDELWPYICHVENIFTMAELHFSFMDAQIYRSITVPRLQGGFPWPLNRWCAYKKRHNCLQLLRTYQWQNCSNEDVIEQLESCCAALTDKLKAADGCYFGGVQPCALDAIVFGHIFTILTTKLPNELLAQTVLRFTRLCGHSYLLEHEYFKNKIEQISSQTRMLQIGNI